MGDGGLFGASAVAALSQSERVHRFGGAPGATATRSCLASALTGRHRVVFRLLPYSDEVEDIDRPVGVDVSLKLARSPLG